MQSLSDEPDVVLGSKDGFVGAKDSEKLTGNNFPLTIRVILIVTMYSTSARPKQLTMTSISMTVPTHVPLEDGDQLTRSELAITTH